MGKNTKKQGSLISTIVMIGVIPLISLSLVLGTYTTLTRYNGIYEEIFNELKGMCICVGELVSVSTDSSGAFVGADDMFDSISTRTEIDITLFEGDTRVVTTVRDDSGSRAIGTKASEQVKNEVLVSGRVFYSDDVEVNGTQYFGYYMPLHGADGAIKGMAFAGKSRSDVEGTLARMIIQSIGIVAVGTVIAASLCIIFARRLVRDVNSAADFLNKVADGDTEGAAETRLTRRNDEIGSMGRSAVKLQQSLRSLISTDPLTGLFNRRACNIQLAEMKRLADEEGAAFSTAIGDIDFFKNFNDRYGHACGDEVLKDIAGILTRCCAGGVVSRWGGEEFLIAFGGSDQGAALNAVSRVMKELESYRCTYNGESIPVTMTFGTSVYNGTQSIDNLINTADQRLYYGKNNGRNRIVTEIPKEQNNLGG